MLNLPFWLEAGIGPPAVTVDLIFTVKYSRPYRIRLEATIVRVDSNIYDATYPLPDRERPLAARLDIPERDHLGLFRFDHP